MSFADAPRGLRRAKPVLLAAAVAVLVCATARAHPHATTALRAGEVHTGDGRVLHDALVVMRSGRIVQVGGSIASGVPVRRVPVLIPGLIAAGLPAVEDSSDPEALAPDRRAADAVPLYRDEERLLRSGVTAAYRHPGRRRLVPGRGTLARLVGPAEERILVEEAALHAVLGGEAGEAPEIFEPPVPANVEHPFVPMPAQPGASWMGRSAAVREALRNASAGGDGGWSAVLRREVPLWIRAQGEREIEAAVELAEAHGFRLVIEGGAESWRLAERLASVGATVVLELPLPGGPAPPEARLDAPGILHRAGVEVVLGAAEPAQAHRLLELAAAAVRGGLPPEAALSAVTYQVAAASTGGAAPAGRIAPGLAADLVVLDAPPLSSRAAPREVLVAGRTVWKAPDQAPPLAIRAGTVRSGSGASWSPGVVVVEDGRVVSVGQGPVPADARLLEFPDAVLTPGLVDAFGRGGLEDGPPARGSAALRGIDVAAAGDDLFGPLLRGGVTAVHLYPMARGPVRGTGSLLHAATGRPGWVAAVEEVGVLFHVGGGPHDEGSRAEALHALEGFLHRAKGYHTKWEAWEKRDEKKEDGEKPRRRKKKEKEPEKPDVDLDLEPLRDVFRGRSRALVRVGRGEAILEAVDLFQGHGIEPVIVGGEEAHRVAADLRGKIHGVILGPALLDRQGNRELLRAARLQRHGIPVAFGSFGGSGEGLGLTAAFAARHGLDPATALQAVTGGVGPILGLDEEARPGTLAVGSPGDLVVFSGDPLDATSRILLVVAAGRIRGGERAPADAMEGDEP